ncbi:hypothetical protein GB937_000019 [Aspergillus fischeri]|nr:hypothetical protein GB937_000019 [Aspergillus fischeri]
MPCPPLAGVSPLYGFGVGWQKIFLRTSQPLEFHVSTEEYNEGLQEALREATESDEGENYSENEHDYTVCHWALVVGRR